MNIRKNIEEYLSKKNIKKYEKSEIFDLIEIEILEWEKNKIKKINQEIQEIIDISIDIIRENEKNKKKENEEWYFASESESE